MNAIYTTKHRQIKVIEACETFIQHFFFLPILMVLHFFYHILGFNAYLHIIRSNNLNLVNSKYNIGLTLVSIDNNFRWTKFWKQKIVDRQCKTSVILV